MNQLSPISIAYKIVKSQDGRLFSANLNGDLIAMSETDNQVVEYKLDCVTYPKSRLPALFVCADLEQARTLFPTFNANKTALILKGLAGNMRKLTDPALKKEQVFTHYLKVCPFLSFSNEIMDNSQLCDWFIPQSFVIIPSF